MSRYQHVIKSCTLITGSGGAFEFTVNGELLYSKLSMQRRHADADEVLNLFRDYIDSGIAEYPQ